MQRRSYAKTPTFFTVKKCPGLWTNPRVFDLLPEPQTQDDWDLLPLNFAPGAVAKMLKNQDKINFSQNKGAIEWLRANQDKIDQHALWANPKAKDLLKGKKMGLIDLKYLAKNTSVWATKKILSMKNDEKMRYSSTMNTIIYSNPGMIVLVKRNEIYELIREHD